MMFVDISLEVLTLGPLISSIIRHHNLLLMGNPSMTSVILTFPGVQPPSNETKMSVCPLAKTHIPQWDACSQSTLWMQWNSLPWLQMALCMLTMFPVRASLLPSHGRGLWPRDVLKKVSRGLYRVEAGNPGFPRLVQVTSGGFSWWL